jgi:hypothetical protein
MALPIGRELLNWRGGDVGDRLHADRAKRDQGIHELRLGAALQPALPGIPRADTWLLASQSATSVSIFPEESVSAYAPTYPDTSLPTSHGVTTVAAGNLENQIYTAAFYQLATVRSAWMGSVESGQSVQH